MFDPNDLFHILADGDGARSAAAAIFIVLVHVIGYGALIARVARLEKEKLSFIIGTAGSAGFAAFGFELFALGYIRGWYQIVLCSSAVVLLIVAICSIKLRPTLKESETALIGRNLPEIFCVGMVACTILIAVLSTFRVPITPDEVQYHWPGPLVWASQHHWTAIQYRFLNGPSLMDLLYLPAALFNSSTAGHLTHLCLWLAMLFSCSALAAFLETPWAPAVAAVVACPTLTTQAPTMLSDVGAAAFLVSSLTTLLSAQGSERPWRRILLSSLLFCSGLSVKPPFAFVLMPAFLCLLLFANRDSAWPRCTARICLFFVPCLLTILMWATHTAVLTGKLDDIRAGSIWANKDDPSSPTRLATPPTIKSIMLLPVTPIITAVLGAQDPYGGRTGLTMCLFGPAFLLAFRKLTGQRKRWATQLLFASTFYFVGIGLFTVRTRYSGFVWVIWSVLAGVGFWYFYKRTGGQRIWLLATMYCLTILIGCTDAIRTMMVWHPEAKQQVIPFVRWLRVD